mmetsp:Transcript_11325/g.36178  ORF Transcript_11325/g.36178 Transcript_11325/m.36178 type:complete len:298 (-) Transcript_11325:193-1086(-)
MVCVLDQLDEVDQLDRDVLIVVAECAKHRRRLAVSRSPKILPTILVVAWRLVFIFVCWRACFGRLRGVFCLLLPGDGGGDAAVAAAVGGIRDVKEKPDLVFDGATGHSADAEHKLVKVEVAVLVSVEHLKHAMGHFGLRHGRELRQEHLGELLTSQTFTGHLALVPALLQDLDRLSVQAADRMVKRRRGIATLNTGRHNTDAFRALARLVLPLALPLPTLFSPVLAVFRLVRSIVPQAWSALGRREKLLGLALHNRPGRPQVLLVAQERDFVELRLAVVHHRRHHLAELGAVGQPVA